jgi:hypothetical protein
MVIKGKLVIEDCESLQSWPRKITVERGEVIFKNCPETAARITAIIAERNLEKLFRLLMVN